MARIIKLLSVAFIIALFYASSVYAQDKLLETKGPFVITSATLTADNKAHTALFEGTVIAKTDDMTIHSDRMLVYYTEKGNLSRIEADGHVKLIKNERVITADAATYFAGDEKVVFTGRPKATEGNNVVSGTKMTFFIREDRSLVEDSKVFIERGPSKGR